MSDLFHPDVPFEFIASVFAVMGATTRHTYQVLTKRPERMLEFFDWALQGLSQHDFAASDKIMDHWPAHIQWRPLKGRRGGYDNCGPAFPFDNVWLGVSAENQKAYDERMPLLLKAPAAIRFVSAEPLLGPIDLGLLGAVSRPLPYALVADMLHWVIVGGESGHKARPMTERWAKDMRTQCEGAVIPFFFKQGSQANWPDFKNPDTFPPSLRVREFPL
jgi:protein gp37